MITTSLHLGLGVLQSAGFIAPPPPDYGLRVVAKGGHLPSDGPFYVSGFTRSERRSRVLIGGQDVKSIRLVFCNLYLSQGEKNGTNAITVEAGFERLSGGAQTVMFTFDNGINTTKTLAPGEYVMTDPILPSAFGLTTFAANSDWRARTGCMLPNTTSTWPHNSTNPVWEPITGQYSAISSSATSQIPSTGALITPPGGTTSSTTDRRCYGPAAIIGEWASAPDVSLMISGDSIAEIQNDIQDNGTTGGGFMVHGVRSVTGRAIPHILCARSAERTVYWTSSAFRKYLMQFCSHYIDNFGTNDVSDSASAATVLTRKQLIWTDFKTRGAGPKYIINTPVMVRATSTDSWQTTGNQTPNTGFAAGGVADTLNSSVLALVGTPNGPDQIVDTGLDWRDGTLTDRWKVNGTLNYPTSDGTHPSPTLHTAAAARLATAASSWVAG